MKFGTVNYTPVFPEKDCTVDEQAFSPKKSVNPTIYFSNDSKKIDFKMLNLKKNGWQIIKKKNVLLNRFVSLFFNNK